MRAFVILLFNICVLVGDFQGKQIQNFKSLTSLRNKLYECHYKQLGQFDLVLNSGNYQLIAVCEHWLNPNNSRHYNKLSKQVRDNSQRQDR